jgi:two-component system, NarL family, sensor histidine kinase DegS
MDISLKEIFVKNRLVRNTHFWIIVAITFLLALFYNASYIHIEYLFPWFKDILAAKGAYSLVTSVLFLIPVLYSSLIYKVRGALISWSVFILAIIPKAALSATNFENIAIISLFALVVLLLGLLLGFEYNFDIRRKVDFNKSKRIRWHYLARLIKIHEYERQYVARKLHDNVIQSLLVVTNKAHAIEANDRSMSSDAKKDIEKLETMLLLVIDDVRRLSQGLRPGVLDNVGLLPVLKWQADRITQDSGIKVEVRVNGLEHRLSPDSEVITYKIVQEALNNICQHSGASSAIVILDFVTPNFKLIIQDNGKGFDVAKNFAGYVEAGKMGLERMRQQSGLLDGTLDIRSEPGLGTTITLTAKRKFELK